MNIFSLIIDVSSCFSFTVQSIEIIYLQLHNQMKTYLINWKYYQWNLEEIEVIDIDKIRRKLYEASSNKTLSKDDNEWLIEYGWKKYTMVRREWIPESFGWIKNVKEFSNWTDATVYLKTLFANYTHIYPELFKPEYDDWYRVDSSEMFPVINKWAKDNEIPYAGLQYSNGGRYWAGSSLSAWLPVRVAGKFACVWSDSGDREAYFGCGGERDACLSVSFY